MIAMITKRLYINEEPTRYLINTDGQIYSEIRKKFLKPFKNPNGYMLVDINHYGFSYTRQLHRLVALTFIPNPDRLPTVNHKDGNKENNAVDNLEWMSLGDNVRHAWSTGLAKPRYGTDNPANVYTEEQIHMVCQLIEIGEYSNKRIADEVGVNLSLIRDIKYRGKWKKISMYYDIPRISKRYSANKAAIMELILKGYSDDNIMETLNLNKRYRIQIEFLRESLNTAPTTIPEKGVHL